MYEPLWKKMARSFCRMQWKPKLCCKKYRALTIRVITSVTDKAPDPGEYRYMTHGAIGVGNLLLSTTILHRVKESESVKDALFMLREAKQSTK